ncbi:MAG: HAD family phosphatase, partial [Spirochaetota bacterium]|nr:HAD family phosphatase [Spirochaetota bacterium]
ATSADRTKMESNLIEIGISEDTFDAVVTALDVNRQKPFPDIYLKAASLIGEDAQDCLVVEDAVNGVKAAKSAGAKCLGLTTSFSKEQLSEADWFAKDLSMVGEEVFNW